MKRSSLSGKTVKSGVVTEYAIMGTTASWHTGKVAKAASDVPGPMMAAAPLLMRDDAAFCATLGLVSVSRISYSNRHCVSWKGQRDGSIWVSVSVTQQIQEQDEDQTKRRESLTSTNRKKERYIKNITQSCGYM